MEERPGLISSILLRVLCHAMRQAPQRLEMQNSRDWPGVLGPDSVQTSHRALGIFQIVGGPKECHPRSTFAKRVCDALCNALPVVRN